MQFLLWSVDVKIVEFKSEHVKSTEKAIEKIKSSKKFIVFYTEDNIAWDWAFSSGLSVMEAIFVGQLITSEALKLMSLNDEVD